MKFAVVLPCYVYNPQRAAWAQAAFKSLARTVQPEKRPLLFLIDHQDSVKRCFPEGWKPGDNFEYEPIVQPVEISGTEQTLAWGTEQVLLSPDVTHVIWMGDDALFNLYWLIELEKLINRHPEAKAWSVYRSAHVRYHAPLSQNGNGDVLVRSLCGHGMTFSRWEWAEWGIDWRQGQRWPSVSGGNTLDLHHACNRAGERWCTGKSFVQHVGTAGVNVTPGIPEWAIDFMGE